ncbi:hypothetical protein Gotur_017027 [Gossypium turneri]
MESDNKIQIHDWCSKNWEVKYRHI